jgi:pimeloyl-ACP methyl ester carboxylesterase
MDVEFGSMGPLPFLAAGSGPPLVFLAGLAPESGVTGRMRKLNLATIQPFADTHRAYFLNRRPGLPAGLTMAALAAEHAAAIGSRFDGPVDVIGASTGGSIAQQLAAEHPDRVRRVVLVSTACRLGPDARAGQRAVAARIRAGADRQALAFGAAALVPPRRGRLAAAALASVVGPRLFPRDGLEDMATTIEAEDTFDLAACPAPIRAPTLVIGGCEDRFYPRELFEETKALIPDSHLEIFAGRGHITVSSDKRFVPTVKNFLGRAGA